MFKPHACLSLVAAFAMTGCLTTQYEDSPVAAVQSPAPVYAQTVPASYSTTSYAAVNEDCRKTETNREIIGSAVGGTAGAFVGKKLIGGTKGTVAGAALGGIAGYGLGDISTNCAPDAPRANAAYQSNASYQSATPAQFQMASCPAGTSPHSSGTCLMDTPSTRLPAQAIAASSSGYAAQNLVRANITVAPSAYRAETAARPYGGANYVVRTGDTVYSLARKLCVPITAIQSSNGLDSNYGIKIGQGLNLPASQC